jgi:hypothetical protein
MERLARDGVGHDDGITDGAGAKMLERDAGVALSGLCMVEPFRGPPESIRIDRLCRRLDELAQAHLSGRGHPRMLSRTPDAFGQHGVCCLMAGVLGRLKTCGLQVGCHNEDLSGMKSLGQEGRGGPVQRRS